MPQRIIKNWSCNYTHVISGTSYKLLEDQSEDASVDDFTPGQLSRVSTQVLAVGEIYTELAQISLETANSLEKKSSISEFFRGDEGLTFERRRDDLFQSISRKCGSKKKVFSTRTHRAYVWEAQYRQTGFFRRDRRGTAQVLQKHLCSPLPPSHHIHIHSHFVLQKGFIHQHEDLRIKLQQYLATTKNVSCEKTWRHVNKSLLPTFLETLPGQGSIADKLAEISKYGLKVPVSRDTVWRWMGVCGAVRGTYKQSYYTDRHNDADVVSDRTDRYLPAKRQLELRCPVWAVISRQQFEKLQPALRSFKSKTGVELPW